MAEPPPSITKLAREDVQAVARLLQASGVELDLEAELRREIALPWVMKSPTSPEPLAFCLVWSVADELQLIDIATHPEQRRKGHARALLNELLSHARREHKRLILLEVRQSNQAAIALYLSVGFTTSGVRRSYYSDTGEDALEMRITLDPNSGRILSEQDA